ncbi:MAG: hypothetical protein ACK2UC_16285 [Anaerolineae bacterium]|jgi:hypothetical protein
MYPTAELRWFYWGAAPRAALDWLEQWGGLPEPQAPRRDYYLRLPGNSSLGIKLREGQIEVKRRTRQRGTARFGENVAGMVEHWRKWSFPIADSEAGTDAWLTPASAWIPVDKARRLHRYGLAADGTLSQVSLERMPQRGCEFELSEVRAQGDMWWSVCLEAFGEEGSLEDSLYAVSALLLSPGWPVAMAEEQSSSYPEWLNRLLDADK